MKKIKYLDLSSNNLDTFLDYLNDIVELDLSFNKISSICNDDKDFVKINCFEKYKSLRNINLET